MAVAEVNIFDWVISEVNIYWLIDWVFFYQWLQIREDFILNSTKSARRVAGIPGRILLGGGFPIIKNM
jgi:hypothetical protein